MSVMPFTKEDIVKAYENLKDLGIKPVQEEFVVKDESGKICGLCAISAYLVDSGEVSLEEINNVVYAKKLGLEDNVRHMYAFTNGFDGNDDYRNPEFLPSFNLGVEIRKEIFGGKENE